MNMTERRLRLRALGYHPLPNKEKQCLVKGWTRPEFVANEISRLEGWEGRWPDFTSTGVRLDNGLGVIDGDVDDKELSGALWNIVEQYAPKVMAKAPIRLGGGSHKAALFVRIEGEAFIMIERRLYVRPEELKAEKPDSKKVEIFGGGLTSAGNCSRQFGVYGPHSPGRDYQWDGKGLDEIALADLPALSKAQAKVIVGAFEDAAEELGWVALPRSRSDGGSIVYDIDENTRFNTNRGDSGINYIELCEAWEMYGDSLRCSSNFMPGRGRNGDRERCSVLGKENRHQCVAVFVHGEGTHYPRKFAAATDAEIAPVVAAAVAAKGMPDLNSGLPPSPSREDYYAFLPTHQYIYKHTGRLYPLASINATLKKVTIGKKEKKQSKKQLVAGEAPEFVEKQIPASLWLDRNRAVMEMTWAPGLPQLIEDKLACEGGWIDRAGVATYNLYRPPALRPGNSAGAARWLELVETLYPDHAGHIIAFCAHRVQFPAIKINHGLVLTGSPGIGKDTLLEPLKQGVGTWNFKEISPHELIGSYNDFMQGVVLRVSETRDLGDVNRYGFYEATKTLLAAPPDMTRINIKHVPQFYIPNITAAIFTTNYPTDGIFLPPDDRRHYVCGTELIRDDQWDQFLIETWEWYASGGIADAVAYLATYDLAGFDAKQPPVKTDAFWRMVDAGRPAEESEFRDTLTRMGDPDAITIASFAAHADPDLVQWMRDRKNNRNVSRRLDDCGYVPVRNLDDRTDGRWKIDGKRQVIYAKKHSSLTERYQSAEKLRDGGIGFKDGQKGKVIPIKP